MPTRRQKLLGEVKCKNNGHRFKAPVLYKADGVEESSAPTMWVAVSAEGIYCREPGCGSPVEVVERVKYV
jgi:hypothetical protein